MLVVFIRLYAPRPEGPFPDTRSQDHSDAENPER